MIVIDKNLLYRQGKTPEKIDNHHYNSFYSAGKEIYNLKSIPLSKSSGEIIDFKVNPAGYSYAVLSRKGKDFSLRIYDTNKQGLILSKIDHLIDPTAITYSPDSRYIYIADNNEAKKFSSKTLLPEKSFVISGKPFKLIMDGNGLFIASLNRTNVDIYNENQGVLRTRLTFPNAVTDATFSHTGDRLIVACEDGSISVYNTRDFSLESKHLDLGKPSSISMHPDDKYVAVSSDSDKIQFLNILDDFDRPYITNSEGPLKYTRFVTNGTGDVFLTFDADKSIVYKRVTGFSPHYTKLARDKVNELMREWSKMRPMETEEEYRARMSPENIERQRMLFANEIATSLAGELIARGTVSLGNYNPHTGMLTVNITGLPPIYLQVPLDDMAGFGDGKNLEFSNIVYGLTPTDNFELIYVDVFNPTNGKKYSFDNLDRENLSFLATDDSFVSLDLIMKSNQEDVLLKGIKDRIVEEARAKNLISEHTVINVDTRIEPTFDANGKSINNYRISFSYSVAPGYSEHEDFPSGKFMIQDSNAALSLMRIIKQAFENEFAAYLGKDKKMIIEITGSADGAPISSGLKYDGSLGEFDNEPVKVNGELTSVSVSSQSGIKSNEQLAFMRAQALRNEMLRELPQLDNMDVEYRNNLEISKNRGGEFRRINVHLTFIDAL